MEDLGILIVDDSTAVRFVLANLFALAGLHVHLAENGSEALAKLRERRFRFLFTDLRMPELDGLELARQAKQIAPDLEIVLGTGETAPGLMCQARQSGISRVVTKPFKRETVLQLARQWKQGPVAEPATEKDWRWLCPRCETPHFGWSPRKSCWRCGHEESPEG